MPNILITGGTGSLGSYLTKELLKDPINRVVVFSRDEEKQNNMLIELSKDNAYGALGRIKMIIGDIRDYNSVYNALSDVDIAINTAAMKEVPTCEVNVWEAVKTNIVGAYNIVQACIAREISTALTISTDKAVNPLNLYGMTKAVQEKIFTDAWRRSGRKFFCVRYGNVLGSRGSVIPLFHKLISQGQSIPVTDARMTRFILPLDTARNLIFSALKLSNGGEIFVPIIKSIKIVDLANIMIKASGKDLKVNIVGIRPGEKLDEVLISADEFPRTYRYNASVAAVFPYAKSDLCTGANIMNGTYTSGNCETFTEQELTELLRKDGWV